MPFYPTTQPVSPGFFSSSYSHNCSFVNNKAMFVNIILISVGCRKQKKRTISLGMFCYSVVQNCSFFFLFRINCQNNFLFSSPFTEAFRLVTPAMAS